MINNRDKLIVIVGPTASGKSTLAIELAKRFNGEILCADSRTVYREADIGTAKPTVQQRAEIPHWGLDLINPTERYTAADYKAYAEQTIKLIAERDKLPIMVGGSGLYIDGLVYDYHFRTVANTELRGKLEALDTEQLQQRVRGAGLAMPENDKNRRYLIRTLESGQNSIQSDRLSGLRPHTLLIGLDPDLSMHEHWITDRVYAMIRDGLVIEATELGAQYGWNAQVMQAPGYREFESYIKDNVTIEETIPLIIKNTKALAKRQKTWFKRNKSIQWLDNKDELTQAVDIITTFLDT